MTHAPFTITAQTMRSADALCGLADRLPQGVKLRFRADASDTDHGYCPFCQSDDIRWTGNTVPDTWDRCACNDCGRSWDEEAHVVEAWSAGESCACGSEGIRQPEPNGVDSVRHCGAPACADFAVNVRIPEVLQDAAEIAATDASNRQFGFSVRFR